MTSININHPSSSESTDPVFRKLHEAAKRTRSAVVLAAMQFAADEYYAAAYVRSSIRDDDTFVASELLNLLAYESWPTGGGKRR